jgi:hypothetical protein
MEYQFYLPSCFQVVCNPPFIQRLYNLVLVKNEHFPNKFIPLFVSVFTDRKHLPFRCYKIPTDLC